MSIKMISREWREIQRKNFIKWEELANFLELDTTQRERLLKKSRFPLNLPLRLARKIAKGTLEDPLLRQFLPLDSEEDEDEAFTPDPLGEKLARPSPKLLHKYRGRALLLPTSSCAMHCRYCFRRHFEYEVKRKELAEEIEILRNDETIREVILSGGDPLSLSNRTLSALIDELEGIDHISKLRFHTRFPIGIPERIDDEFVAMIANSRFTTYFVIHCNHPKELDDEILSRLSALQKKGVILLNQSVLLKGVNDNFETLYTLCETLINNAILPYYLHQLDKVAGATHFQVAQAKGLKLIEELKKHLPGYAIPRYVKEVAGEPCKRAIYLDDQ